MTGNEDKRWRLTPAAIETLSHVLSSKLLPDASAWKPKPEELKLFAGSGNAEDERRAAYFAEAVKYIQTFGLYNPHEHDLLTFEPFHALLQSAVSGMFTQLGFQGLEQELRAAGLTVFSPGLLDAYSKTSTYTDLLKSWGHDGRFCVFDPYYAFAIWKDKQRTRNVSISLSTIKFIQSTRQFNLSPTDLSAITLAVGPIRAQKLFVDHLSREARKTLSTHEAPEIVVHGWRDLLTLIQKLSTTAKTIDPKIDVWFRGQPYDYLVPSRASLVSRGIALYSDIQDSSLVTSLFRELDRHTDDLAVYETFIRSIAEWLYAAKSYLGQPRIVEDPASGAPAQEFYPSMDEMNHEATMTFSFAGEPAELAPQIPDLGPITETTVRDPQGNVTASYRKRFHMGWGAYRMGLVLQHYGCPTGWLDITHDVKVAAWFALHEFLRTPAGNLPVRRKWAGTSQDKWPTIFVFPLASGIDPFLDSGAILKDTDALRPVRQHCGLLAGGGNLWRNYPARYIALKIRLAPDFMEESIPTADKLFPDSSEDGLLKKLLEARSQSFKPWNIPIFQSAKG